jgi:FtsP/CotA-like multicopper oxidase with cupredoxin domain
VADVKLRYGIDSELTGAIVVDPPGQITQDEIFVIEMISEHAGLSSRQTLATINGKSWPFTQHFRYEIGQPVHWRWINATNEPQALHLHGFYFRVDAYNHSGLIQRYRGDSRPLVVTQRIAQGDTFDMSRSSERAGQWLFHCHMVQHMTPPIVPKVPGLEFTVAGSDPHDRMALHEAAGMGQLVLGIFVPSQANAQTPAPWQADRKLQLEISERSGAPRYALSLRDSSQSTSNQDAPGLTGPPIVLTRGQPVEIEVVNKLHGPTAIHWHGIELESYYDGVPGWSGDKQITPPIAPGSSFVARMVPPRAGTFISHTHWHDEYQLTNGIYGPLIVLPLARDEHVLAIVVLPSHVVVMAAHKFHIGFERWNFSRALHRRDHVLHHQIAIGQRVVLRPVHRADVVLEVLCALRQVREVLVRQVDHPLAHVVLCQLDEEGAEAIAYAARSRVQQEPDVLAFVEADLDEVVSCAKRPEVIHSLHMVQLGIFVDDRW